MYYHFKGKVAEMGQIIIDEKDVIIKRYRIRSTGKDGATLETSIPREVFDREARRLGMTVEDALEKLVAVWRFNGFRGLHLSFECKVKQK